MDKHAVDSKTEEYWSAYFGEYGKQWTRTIPRRIATALAQRTAAAGGDEPEARLLRMRPIGVPAFVDGKVLVEGSCVLGVGDVRFARLFSAAFDDSSGRLLNLDSVPVPLA